MALKTQDRYDRLDESIDLFFTMVSSMDTFQQQMSFNSHVVEKTVKDQVLLTKQMKTSSKSMP
jgi:hypothetical protein